MSETARTPTLAYGQRWWPKVRKGCASRKVEGVGRGRVLYSDKDWFLNAVSQQEWDQWVRDCDASMRPKKIAP